MDPYAVINLHCDTLTASLSRGRVQALLDDPCSDFSLSKLPSGVHWGQCFSISIPNGLSPDEALRCYQDGLGVFQGQMDLLSRRVSHCRTVHDLENAWDHWKTAAILAVENGAALRKNLEQAEMLARDGVRILSLGGNGENEIGPGQETACGLSPFEKELTPELEKQGVLIDVSHMGDPALEDLLSTAKAPFLATHSNARSVCGQKCNLTDDQIRELAARRCLIGLNYTSSSLRTDGLPATPDDLFRHVEHFVSLGAEDCLALGSDFDGDGISPLLHSPKQAAELYSCFLGRGLLPALCSKLMFKNALDFFAKNLR